MGLGSSPARHVRLKLLAAEWVRDVEPGEMVIIDDSGIRDDTYTTDTQLAVCSMEYIYFARPDSVIHGINVHTARKIWGAVWLKSFNTKQILLLVCLIHHFQVNGFCRGVQFAK